MEGIFMTQRTETSICGAIGTIILLAALTPVAILIFGMVWYQWCTPYLLRGGTLPRPRQIANNFYAEIVNLSGSQAVT